MARIKRLAPTVRSTPPRAAKKSPAVSSSGRKELHSEEEYEEGTIDESEEEDSKHSGEQSDGSEEEEATEAEDADDSESEARDELEEEAHDEAEESESNAEEVVQQKAHAADNTSSDESNPNGIDRYADLNEEDKKDIRSLQFSDEQVLEYEEMLKLLQNDYGRFMKVQAIPKLIKHLTPQQTIGAIQYISNQLDPKNNRVPDIDEIRSFLYLQELVLLFAKKESIGKTHFPASDSEEDEDSDKSTVKESKKKAKSKKKIQAQCKYYCS
jgi:hypothetical protein